MAKSYSYRAEAASRRCSGADWSRLRAEGNLTVRHTDPRLRHTEPGARCTLGDLDGVNRIITMPSDVLEMMRFEICLHLESQEEECALLSLCRQQQQTLSWCIMHFSDVLLWCIGTASVFCSIWLRSLDYLCVCAGMWPLTLCCSPVDRRAGLAAPWGVRSMLKEQRYTGHMAPGTSFWQGGLSVHCWAVYLT